MHSDHLRLREPLISVIIPVYNIAEYLPQCLESLQSQTLQDFEVLCVDDESSDGSVELLREYQKRDRRFFLLQQSHGGVSAARNLGIRRSRGKYILFFDGDDWAEQDMLERLVSAAEATKADITICSAYVHCESADKSAWRRLASLQRELTVEARLWERGESADSSWKVLEMPGSWPFVWNKLIRGDLVRENNILFSEGLRLGEDGLFLQILFQYANRVSFIESTLYHYRYQRKNSATVDLFQIQQTRFNQHMDVIRELCREFQRRNMLESDSTDVLRWITEFLYRDFLHLPASRQPEVSGELAKVLRTFDLLPHGHLLDRITQKRLNELCGTSQAPSKTLRAYRLLRTKIENCLIRFMNREDNVGGKTT